MRQCGPKVKMLGLAIRVSVVPQENRAEGLPKLGKESW